jgi:hypothetical protein
VYFLVAGLMILAIFLAVFSIGIEQVEGKTQNRNPVVIEAVKTFYIPSISASNISRTETVEIDNTELHNGLLFGENSIKYNLQKSGLNNIFIKFKVGSNNGLGKLVIRVNGKIAENRIFEPGEYSIPVDSSLFSDRALVEIFAESSFWRIWAPDIYKLSGIKIEYSSFESGLSQYKFYLGEEFKTIEFSKIDLSLNRSIGSMIIELNGRKILESPVASLQSIKLDSSYLRLGDNIIVFKSKGNSLFEGSGNIVVVFTTTMTLYNDTGITAVQQYIGSTY